MQIFRLLTACMKINQILYVIFQATSQFSFIFCNTLQCHDTLFLWNFLAETCYMLWTKKAHQSTLSQTFECSNESSFNCSCHFWNLKIRVYSSFESLFSFMKDNSSVFFSSNIIYFGQKEPIKVKFSGFCVVEWKFTKFLMSYLKPQAIFSLCELWNQESGIMCHDNEEWSKVWRGIDLSAPSLSSSKLIWEIWQILTRALKSLKNLLFNWLLLTRVHNVWAKKVQRSYLS